VEKKKARFSQREKGGGKKTDFCEKGGGPEIKPAGGEGGGRALRGKHEFREREKFQTRGGDIEELPFERGGEARETFLPFNLRERGGKER